MEGWISLHRKTIDWEWYNEPNTFRLFVHCLLKANHSGKKWRGINIERGSFITSHGKLAEELDLSVSKIRTAINNLKSTSEIASESNSKYTVIKVVKYGEHQCVDKPDNKQIASKSQSNRNQIATTNNNNTVNNNNKEYIKEKKHINSFDRNEVKKELLSEVNLKHLAATLEKGVSLNGGNFKKFQNPVERIKGGYGNFWYVLTIKEMSFTDVNHIKNYFRIFLEKFWNLQDASMIINKMNREFRKQNYKK